MTEHQSDMALSRSVFQIVTDGFVTDLRHRRLFVATAVTRATCLKRIATLTYLSLGAIVRGWHRTVYAKPSHFVDQGRAFHSQPCCRTVQAAYDPVAQFESAEDVIPFQLFKTRYWRIRSQVSAERLQFGNRSPQY